MNNLDDFAHNLKHFRSVRDITQEKLAVAIGVSAQTISAYEKKVGEKGKNPTLEKAIALAKFLNVSLDELCGLKQGPTHKLHNLADVVQYLNELACYFECSIGYQFVDLPEEFWVRTSRADGGIDEDTSEKTALFQIHSPRLANFFENRNKMLHLMDEGMINEELYRTWYEGELELLRKREVKKQDEIGSNNDNAIGIIPLTS